MNSPLFSLDRFDWIKGAIMAVLVPGITWLASALSVPGVSFEALNWHELLSISLAAAVAYLTKNFLTTEKGNLLGMIPTR